MITEVRKFVDNKGRSQLNVCGIDFGSGGLFILRENDKKILCRRAGYNWRVSLGNMSYSNPEFIIFHKSDANTIVNALPRDDDVYEYTRETRKVALNIMLKRFEED